MFPLIKFKKDDGYEMIININHIVSLVRMYDSSDYRLTTISGEVKLSWKEFDKLDKLLQNVSERE